MNAEKEFEERKRERMFDPLRRWRHIHELIAWTEKNLPEDLRRSTPRGAKRAEAKLLEYFGNR